MRDNYIYLYQRVKVANQSNRKRHMQTYRAQYVSDSSSESEDTSNISD